MVNFGRLDIKRGIIQITPNVDLSLLIFRLSQEVWKPECFAVINPSILVDSFSQRLPKRIFSPATNNEFV